MTTDGLLRFRFCSSCIAYDRRCSPGSAGQQQTDAGHGPLTGPFSLKGPDDHLLSDSPGEHRRSPPAVFSNILVHANVGGSAVSLPCQVEDRPIMHAWNMPHQKVTQYQKKTGEAKRCWPGVHGNKKKHEGNCEDKEFRTNLGRRPRHLTQKQHAEQLKKTEHSSCRSENRRSPSLPAFDMHLERYRGNVA